MQTQRTQRSKLPVLLIASLTLTGLGYSLGGVKLSLLGGSPYYLLAGVALLLTAGLLLWRRLALALLIYGGFGLATLVWSLIEAGMNAWALLPRLWLPIGLGLWLACHGLRRPAGRAIPAAAFCLITALVSTGILGLAGVSVNDAGSPYPDKIDYADTLVTPADGRWPEYGGTLGGTRFSALAEINPDTVADLELAWSYRTGIVQEGEPSHLQATPLMVNDTLYFCTQTNVVIALDPETGMERWRHDPQVDPTGGSMVRTCRGVAYAELEGVADCPRRIIAATFTSELMALDADTGELCTSFGEGGKVDLGRGMGELTPGFSYVSSAPTIVRHRIVIGGWIADNVSVGEPSGVIRAFDLASGEFAWAWDMGRPGDYSMPEGDETFTRGTPNSWGPMSGDDALGMVYVPMGNATPDHWGGHRSPEMEAYSSAVVALNAETGEPVWHYQTVHHDLWDYDVAGQPSLVDLTVNGERVPGLIQPTKTGQLFLLDRRSGKLLAGVEERSVVVDPTAGDWMAATQPESTELPTFSRETLGEEDMWGISPFDQMWCRIRFREVRYDGPYTPIGSERFSLVYPGVGGGINWGGVSVDAEHGVAFVNSMRVGSLIRLIPRNETATEASVQHMSGGPQLGTPFSFVWDTFVSPLQIPCNEPPFGQMSAVDLQNKSLLWSVPLGTARDSGPWFTQHNLPLKIGVPNFGGSLVTRAGLVFIAATHEKAIRAFDAKTGQVVWKHRLPAGGMANPMTYRSPKSGRQFVVIVAGGHRISRSPLADYVQAFALPKATASPAMSAASPASN